MIQDNFETLMIFKVFPEGDVIALMPEADYGHGLIHSYMRLGQHGGASLELIDELRDATTEERKALVNELNSLGYKVKEGN